MDEAGARPASSASRALNLFLADVYGPQEMPEGRHHPGRSGLSQPCYRPEMVGLQGPARHLCHIAGIDVVRVDADTFYVLEDNARTPSGVSYMLENREVMMRLFPELFADAPRRAGRQLCGRAARRPCARSRRAAPPRTRPSCC